MLGAFFGQQWSRHYGRARSRGSVVSAASVLGVGGRRTARVYLVGDNEGIAAGEDDKVNEVFRGSAVCAATRPATDLRHRADWARLPVPGLPILAD